MPGQPRKLRQTPSALGVARKPLPPLERQAYQVGVVCGRAQVLTLMAAAHLLRGKKRKADEELAPGEKNAAVAKESPSTTERAVACGEEDQNGVARVSVAEITYEVANDNEFPIEYEAKDKAFAGKVAASPSLSPRVCLSGEEPDCEAQPKYECDKGSSDGEPDSEPEQRRAADGAEESETDGSDVEGGLEPEQQAHYDIESDYDAVDWEKLSGDDAEQTAEKSEPTAERAGATVTYLLFPDSDSEEASSDSSKRPLTMPRVRDLLVPTTPAMDEALRVDWATTELADTNGEENDNGSGIEEVYEGSDWATATVVAEAVTEETQSWGLGFAIPDFGIKSTLISAHSSLRSAVPNLGMKTAIRSALQAAETANASDGQGFVVPDLGIKSTLKAVPNIGMKATKATAVGLKATAGKMVEEVKGAMDDYEDITDETSKDGSLLLYCAY